MASPLNGRVKRLEVEARTHQLGHYILGSEGCASAEEWFDLYGEGDKNIIEELKPLLRRSYIRRYKFTIRRGALKDSIEEAMCRPRLEAAKTEIWICSSRTEAHELMGGLAKADALSHALVFTDLQDEMGLGPGRHRVDQ